VSYVGPSTNHSTVTPRTRARRTAVTASSVACRPLSMSDTVACDIVESGGLAALTRSCIDNPRAVRASLMRRPRGVAFGFRAMLMRRVYASAGERLRGQLPSVRLATMEFKIDRKGKRHAALEDRFWPRVEKTDGGCWVWRGRTNEWGYGLTSVGGRSTRAHRASWEMHNGPIPAGLWVLHRCDNPPCVNPAHLFIGDRAANTADMVAKNRQARHPGAKSPRAKLTDDAVRELRALRSAGVQYKDLAARFGVSKSCVREAIIGSRWGHLDGALAPRRHKRST